MLRVPTGGGANSFVEWVGQNSTASGGTVHGFSSADGVDIVRIDFAGSVVLEVANVNPDLIGFRVRNNANTGRFGNVTMIW